MERISYTHQRSEQGKNIYLLSIDYQNETYERLIDESNFTSSYILLADLDKAILDGLEYNPIREYSFLDIKTIIDKKDLSTTCSREHLIVIIDCNTRTRKRRKEIFSFALFKKNIFSLHSQLVKVMNETRLKQHIFRNSCPVKCNFIK
jgi:hypothetical protein